MHMLTRPLTNHAGCAPAQHRTVADPNVVGESVDADGKLCCFSCTGPLMHCDAAKKANDDPDTDGYQRQYLHLRPENADSCPAEQ